MYHEIESIFVWRLITHKQKQTHWKILVFAKMHSGVRFELKLNEPEILQDFGKHSKHKGML